MADEFKFEVGSRYENMKGIYEVISIQKNAMAIRWTDGSVANTTVDLQMRILERMALEKEMIAQKETKKAEKKRPKTQKATASDT